MLDRQMLTELSAKARPGVKVLSVYLDIDSATGLWKDKLYTLQRTLDTLGASVRDGDRRHYSEERAKVEQFFASGYKAHGRGLVVFSSTPQKLWWVKEFRVPVNNEVRFDAQPHIGPMADMLDEYQRYCVALVDNQDARLFLVHMGEIEEYEEIQDYVPKRHSQTEHNARVERQHAAKVLVHVKGVVAAIDAMHKQRPFNRLVTGGAAEALPKMEKELPKHLASLVVGHISVPMYAANMDILHEAMKVEERFERTKEQTTVDDLITKAAKRDLAVVGADQTLLALRERRVFELVVAAGHKLRGVQCPACGFASATIATHCSLCDTRLNVVDDVIDIGVRQAVSNSARVEVVHGSARERLLREGEGIGAVLRPKAS